jgi:hypothetical protein
VVTTKPQALTALSVVVVMLVLLLTGTLLLGIGVRLRVVELTQQVESLLLLEVVDMTAAQSHHQTLLLDKSHLLAAGLVILTQHMQVL